MDVLGRSFMLLRVTHMAWRRASHGGEREKGANGISTLSRDMQDILNSCYIRPGMANEIAGRA